MAKIGRNDPCHCGSGKKYKHCHLPIEEGRRSEQMRLRRTIDSLIPKLIEAGQSMPEQVALALTRYWNGRYAPAQLAELDSLEDRGADRFLTWFVFDYRLDDGHTLVEQVIDDPSELELTELEAGLLPRWGDVRLGAYEVMAIDAGHWVTVRDLLSEQEHRIEDQSASRRMLLGEILVGHLVPAGEYVYIAGAAAHLTEDTREKIREFLRMHLEAFTRDHPGADSATLLREQSEIINHFVLQLPVDKPNPGLLDTILAQTRADLKLAEIPAGPVPAEE
jgi:hypothetical protein